MLVDNSRVAEYERLLSDAQGQKTPAMVEEAMFLAFMFLRHQAWHRRTVLQLPELWVGDPVMGVCRFPNVWRELDRTTLYVSHEILEKVANREHAFILVTLFRVFNRIKTWEAIVSMFDGLHGVSDALVRGVDIGPHVLKAIGPDAKGGIRHAFKPSWPMGGAIKLAQAGDYTHVLQGASSAMEAEPGLKSVADRLLAIPHLGEQAAWQVAMDLCIPVLRIRRSWMGTDGAYLDREVMFDNETKAGARAVRPDLPPATTVRYMRENWLQKMMAMLGTGAMNNPPMAVKGLVCPMRTIDVARAMKMYPRWRAVMDGKGFKGRWTPSDRAGEWKAPDFVPAGWRY